MNDFKAVQAANKAGVALKAMKSMQTMDGLAWSANIYFQGKKVGHYENRGDGGASFVRIPDAALKALRAEAIAVGYECEYCDPKTSDDDVFAEHFLSVVADELEGLKRIKPKLKTKIYAHKKGSESMVYVAFNIPFSEEHKRKIIEHNGDIYDYFLNEHIDALLGNKGA